MSNFERGVAAGLVAGLVIAAACLIIFARAYLGA
jgi:hypothetical protein